MLVYIRLLFSGLAPRRYELQLRGLIRGRVSDNKENDWHPLSLRIQAVFRGAYREQTYQTFVYLAGDNLRFKEHTSGLIFYRISGKPYSEITHIWDRSIFLKQNIILCLNKGFAVWRASSMKGFYVGRCSGNSEHDSDLRSQSPIYCTLKQTREGRCFEIHAEELSFCFSFEN